MILLRKFTKKITSVVLVAALLVGVTFNQSYVKAKETPRVFYENGNEYEMTSTVNGGKTSVEVTNNDTKDKYFVTYDGSILEVVNYVYQGTDLLNLKKYEIKKNTYDINKMAKKCEENEVNAQAYTSKASVMYPTVNGNYYWYQTGYSGYDIGYSKVGCDLTYKVKNSTAGSYLTTYTDAIDASNNYYYASGASAAAVLILFGLFSSGIGTAAALVIAGAMITIDTAAVTCLWNSFTQYQKAAKYYNYVKEYAIN